MTDQEFEALWGQLVQKGQQGYLDNPIQPLANESYTVKQLAWQVATLKTMVKGLVMALTDKGYLIPVSLETPYMVPNPAPAAAKPLIFEAGPWADGPSQVFEFDVGNADAQSTLKTWMATMEKLYKQLEGAGITKIEKGTPAKPTKPHSVKIVKKPKLIATDTEGAEKPP